MTSDRYVRKYNGMLFHFDTEGYKNWASEVRNILSVKGFTYIWEDQGVENEITFMRAFDQRVKNQFLQTRKSQISSGNKLAFYSSIKFQHCLENYFNILKISKFRNALSSLRVSCHSLEIKKGRHRGEEREIENVAFVRNSSRMNTILY